MRHIELMINDGMIGPKSVLLALSSLTTGNLNSKLKKEATPYKMKDILPMVYDYILPPLTPEQESQQAQRALLAFAQSKPNAPENITKIAI